MARMRTIKPEFWDDEVVGCLSRDARLLFIATWNAADDEGLLRWNGAYLKAQAFMYDDDIDLGAVAKLMQELADAQLVFPYRGGGRMQQELGCVVNFHKHQRVNRPQPSKLPPPPLQNAQVAEMYGRRDGWTCCLCSGAIGGPGEQGQSRDLELAHVVPRSDGGTDYPSNIRASHGSCSASANGRLPERRGHSVSDSLNDSREPDEPVSDEFTAVVGKGKGKGGEKTVTPAEPPAAEDPPPPSPSRLDIERLCAYLADRVEANGSRRPVVTAKWRDAARLMLDRDGRTEQQVRAAIDWCQDDAFWRSNVMSMPKLREQYDRLRLQAAGRGRDGPGRSHAAYRNPEDQSVYDRGFR